MRISVAVPKNAKKLAMRNFIFLRAGRPLEPAQNLKIHYILNKLRNHESGSHFQDPDAGSHCLCVNRARLKSLLRSFIQSVCKQDKLRHGVHPGFGLLVHDVVGAAGQLDVAEIRP